MSPLGPSSSPPGTAPPPLGYAATSATATSSSSRLEAARKDLRALGRFDDEGSPLTEAEYRVEFKNSTDEEADPLASPRSWPLHLSEAVNQLNNRVIPSLGYTPRELLTGMLTPERKAEIGQDVRSPTSSHDVEVNLALTYALRNDAFANILEHANRRKRAFDKKVKPIEYKKGALVQKYDARLDETHNAVRKLAGRWSGAVRVVERLGNSYRLEDLEGKPFAAAAHARLLRPFIAKAGTPLAVYAEKLRNPQNQQVRSSSPEPQLPVTARPEERLPLPREDATQPNNYQDDEDSESETS
ncbi:hypothetical protein RSOLAG1IB_11454 [Rhizoctonia solani AG-1 IB]|uniref:Uncharacterized protein n=1 Tax=Thanatephorus cucumeris (strain AG1-IB / isolate 7/3/14) TaxID=1108050 RepID=M5C840_THACB|nr:hypothetical protein BN14_06064 [Rhizoctonia solani AG-1 IB]CEL53718.1 hypothetical protein RSOLAG1IB_11454 [Rhizoctonia solani AG-1 IB]